MLWVVLGLVCGGEPADGPAGAPGKLDAVTLYHGHAAVTRIVDVPAGKGMMEVIVSELPERVVVDSLHADSTEDVQVRAVRYRERTLREEPREGVEEIDKKLEALAQPLREIEHARELIRKKLSFVEKLSVFSTERAKQEFDKGALRTEELSKLAAFVYEQHDTLGKQLHDLASQERKLEDEMAALQLQRTRLTETKSWLSREAVLLVEKSKEGKTTVRFGYLAEGVDWQPGYCVRATSGSQTVAFEYNATVRQTSGEDWRDARITLSTATPTLSAEAPTLAPLEVILEEEPATQSPHDVMKVERERQAAEREFRSAPTDEARQQAQAAANIAAAQLNVLYLRGGLSLDEAVPRAPRRHEARAVVVSYPLEGRPGIQSRPDDQTIAIRSLKLKADFHRRAEPALTRYIYRQAQMTNTSDVPFLRGRASAYVDGRFAGTGTIPLVRPGQGLTVGFGVDPRLAARQVLVGRKPSIHGGNLELTLTYEVRLENFSDQPLDVRVLDRFPVPSGDRLYVALLESEPALSTDKQYVQSLRPRNILRWDVAVPAGAVERKALTIQYQFKVGYDKTLRIRASRAVTPILSLLRPLEPWKVETAWSPDTTELSLLGGGLGEPETMTLKITRGRTGKNVIGRRVEGDLTGFRWLVLDMDNQMKSGIRVAIGLTTGRGETYSESTATYVRPGRNPNVAFDLAASSYKTEANKWEYGVRLQLLDDVRAIYLVFYPGASGSVAIHGITLAK
jgi:uncharacterized protein (TIGR02231 family)